MDVAKSYKFTGFGAMDVAKLYNFIAFGAMDVAKPDKFLGFGARHSYRGYASCCHTSDDVHDSCIKEGAIL